MEKFLFSLRGVSPTVSSMTTPAQSSILQLTTYILLTTQILILLVNLLLLLLSTVVWSSYCWCLLSQGREG